MDKTRMQKLADLNEGTVFKNGKFELQRYHGSTVSSGNWCQSKEVAELEQLASEMYGILNDLADIVHGADQMIVAKADVLQKAARDVIKKAKSL